MREIIGIVITIVIWISVLAVLLLGNREQGYKGKIVRVVLSIAVVSSIALLFILIIIKSSS